MVLDRPFVNVNESTNLLPPQPTTIISHQRMIQPPPPPVASTSLPAQHVPYIPVSQHTHHTIPKEKKRSFCNSTLCYCLLVAGGCIACCTLFCYTLLFSTTILPYIIGAKLDHQYCKSGEIDKENKMVTTIPKASFTPEMKITGVGDVQLYLTRAQIYSDFAAKDTTISKANHWLSTTKWSSIFGENSLDISPKFFYMGNATCLQVQREIIYNTDSGTDFTLTTTGTVKVTRDPDFYPQLRGMNIIGKEITIGDASTKNVFDKINAVSLQSAPHHPIQVFGVFNSYTLIKAETSYSTVNFDLQNSGPSLAVSGNNIDVNVNNCAFDSYSNTNIDIKVSSSIFGKNNIVIQLVQQPYYNVPIIISNAAKITFHGGSSVFQVVSSTPHSARAIFVGTSASSSSGDRHISIDAHNVNVSFVYISK